MCVCEDWVLLVLYILSRKYLNGITFTIDHRPDPGHAVKAVKVAKCVLRDRKG